MREPLHIFLKIGQSRKILLEAAKGRRVCVYQMSRCAQHSRGAAHASAHRIFVASAALNVIAMVEAPLEASTPHHARTDVKRFVTLLNCNGMEKK